MMAIIPVRVPVVHDNYDKKESGIAKDHIRERKKKRAERPGEIVCCPVSAPAPSAAFKSIPIVGLGASAGGLEALEKFLSHVPPDCGIGFVVVTHQHPGHTSLLPELLGKCTRMRVKVAADGMAVEPNTVYLSLPDGYLAILLAFEDVIAGRETETVKRKDSPK